MALGVIEPCGTNSPEGPKDNGKDITPRLSNDGISLKIINAKDRHDAENQKVIDGDAHFHRLGWKRLAVILVVESIALGSLGLPYAFATLGMVAGVILCIGVGLVAMYASYVIGRVKVKYPHVAHYSDIGPLLMGKFGGVLFDAIFVSQITLLVASHCLTGTIAFTTITESNICPIIFGVVSAIIMLILAIPPTFTDMAILGYIDFASIILAIGITMIATGIQGAHMPGGLGASTWSAWPKEGVTFSEAISSLNAIVFAYAFAGAQPTFMDEMHTPKDYVKSIWVLGFLEIVIYTLTGSIIYFFVGQGVQSPALLSAGPLFSRVVFGVALPVIFISGSINITVVARYVHGRIYKDSAVRYVNTRKGWITWLGLVVLVSIVSWFISEAIPFFPELLSLSASLFVSGLSFYFPPVMWWHLLKEGGWYDKRNLRSAMYNIVVFIVGLAILGCGTYSSVVELVSFKLSTLKYFD
ncbi:hypothetical protein NW755_014621 [Fusarium falciforme]|uniref:Amino acid transporter transmembrane domain-containing protein n=1 Tax=Fusarium falciforme TaxID=195108 RepID=A0A9W8URQ9_9HYPO|nr:hypothetical protein NW755_014621 [Fusarium falciforme]